MLQVSYLRDHKKRVLERLAVKNFTDAALLDEVIALDDDRKHLQNESDQLLAQSNVISKEVGDLMKTGKRDEAEVLKRRTVLIKDQVRDLSARLTQTEDNLTKRLVLIPNLPHVSVPRGSSSEDNEIVLEDGLKPILHKGALPHWELAAKYRLIDFELGNKITGAGFPVYMGKGAKVQRSLVQYFLDEAVKAGYTEVQPPILVNEASAFATGQLPDKEGQMYFVGADSLYLIPTAEVPLTNIYRDTIVREEELPIRNCAYTPCFRREAGSYGANVRGLNRLHQFDKVEIVQISQPEKSYEALEGMSVHVQGLLKSLGLPYRLIRLCGGDMTFTSALTYDLEVFSGAQAKWLEVSSVSNFETYQATRLKLRYKGKEGKTQLAHTLNGSALALPRILAAILENNQDEAGITIPLALVPYTGFDRI